MGVSKASFFMGVLVFVDCYVVATIGKTFYVKGGADDEENDFKNSCGVPVLNVCDRTFLRHRYRLR